jgi:hypothetical protein
MSINKFHYIPINLSLILFLIFPFYLYGENITSDKLPASTNISSEKFDKSESSYPDTGPHGFGFGPSFGYCLTTIEKKNPLHINSDTIKKKKHGYSANFDISYTYNIISPGINLKLINLNNKLYYDIRFELAVWAIFVWGGGIGYTWGYNKIPTYTAFIGYPIPLPTNKGFLINNLPLNMRPFKIYYCEPYVRININTRDTIVEIGLMIKISTFDLSSITGKK